MQLPFGESWRWNQKTLGMARLAWWLSNFGFHREARSSLCDRFDRNHHLMVWAGTSLSARRNMDPIDFTVYSLYLGWTLGNSWSTLVVFSFQISKPT